MTTVKFHYTGGSAMGRENKAAIMYAGAKGRYEQPPTFTDGVMTLYVNKRQRRNLRSWVRRHPEWRDKFDFDKQVDS